MADLEALAAQIRAVLEKEVSANLRGKAADPKAHVWGGRRPAAVYPEALEWLALAAKRGWTAPTWPKEYGGAAWTREEAKVLEGEIARLDLPPPLVGFGLTMIGPTLLQFGSEALKREHLPRITRGEIRWCQGYSEPNAGSDLASLQTTAVRDGDEYVVNGQKIWTSYGDLSDWMFMLVRTDPAAKKKQVGITFLLVDLATRGVEVRPIRLISGASPFCETFFADVRVPVVNVVGEVNAGWTVAKALLGHERSMIASVMGSGGRRDVPGAWDLASNRLAALAREQGAADDPLLRDRIAQLSMDELCFQLTVQRAADGAAAGQRPGPESSMFKLYGTELNQRRQELMLAIRGPQALGWEGAGFSADDLQQARDWLRSRGNSIEGGTSEVQLNVIAKQVLGLPD
ncbi:MAG TPA: acyl-CoA dehydrogenase family protein [Polyangiaceae bacterium]|nr:acyl-CoA dehydrogenase family protein [Polyangiaceae bacterium]